MIRRLRTDDAAALARLLQSQAPSYLDHFHPFAFDERTLGRQIASAIRDGYWAIEMEGELAGFFMLRGLDAGYARPSFGIFVAERWGSRGLAAAALEFSKAWCIEHDISTMMLKVAPDHAAAHRVYQEAGFVPVGTCPDTGHTIHEWRSAPS